VLRPSGVHCVWHFAEWKGAVYTVEIFGEPLGSDFQVYTANPFGNTLTFSVLTPLATKSFEPNPVWQRYSMETDSIEYSIKKVAPTTSWW
jgi:hypothetical protein